MDRPSAATRTRTTTCVLALWSAYIATWAVVSGSDPAMVATWWLAGAGLVRMLTGGGARPGAADGEPPRG